MSRIVVAGPWAVWWIGWWFAGWTLLVAGAPLLWVRIWLLSFGPPEILGVYLNSRRDDDLARTFSEVMQWVASWTPGSAALRSWDALVTGTVAMLAWHLWSTVSNWSAPESVALAWYPTRPVEGVIAAATSVGLLIYHLHNRRKWK